MSLRQWLAQRNIEKARQWNQQYCKAAKLPGHACLTNWSPKHMSCSCEISNNWGYFLNGVCWRLRRPHLENTRLKKGVKWQDLLRVMWDANSYHKTWKLPGTSSWTYLKKKCLSTLTTRTGPIASASKVSDDSMVHTAGVFWTDFQSTKLETPHQILKWCPHRWGSCFPGLCEWFSVHPWGHWEFFSWYFLLGMRSSNQR